MIDYKKAEQADKLLLESGVPFMLAYDDTAKHMICRTAYTLNHHLQNELNSCNSVQKSNEDAEK